MQYVYVWWTHFQIMSSIEWNNKTYWPVVSDETHTQTLAHSFFRVSENQLVFSAFFMACHTNNCILFPFNLSEYLCVCAEKHDGFESSVIKICRANLPWQSVAWSKWISLKEWHRNSIRMVWKLHLCQFISEIMYSNDEGKYIEENWLRNQW